MYFTFSTRQTCIVFKLGWSWTARMPAWSLVLLPCLHITPRCRRQADGQLSPLCSPSSSFSSLWCRLRETLLSSSSLDGQKHASLLSRLVWNVGNIKFVLPWTCIVYRTSYLRTEWMRWQWPSQFEHDHRRTADRAPQITASFTRDQRRAHWYI